MVPVVSEMASVFLVSTNRFQAFAMRLFLLLLCRQGWQVRTHLANRSALPRIGQIQREPTCLQALADALNRAQSEYRQKITTFHIVRAVCRCTKNR